MGAERLVTDTESVRHVLGSDDCADKDRFSASFCTARNSNSKIYLSPVPLVLVCVTPLPSYA